MIFLQPEESPKIGTMAKHLKNYYKSLKTEKWVQQVAKWRLNIST